MPKQAKQRDVLVRIPQRVFDQMLEERAFSGDGASVDLVMVKFRRKPILFTAKVISSKDVEES